MKSVFPFLFLLLLASCRKDPVTDPSPPLFTHFYGTAGDETGREVRVLPDSGLIVCGYGAGTNGGTDFFLLRTDKSGEQEWLKYYGSSGDEVCWSFDQTADGGFVIGGYSNGIGNGNDDFLVVKTDADGNEEWRKTYGGPLGDQLIHIRALADGFLLSGITHGGFDENALVIRLDANGDSLWSFVYGGAGADGAMYSCEGYHGEHVITGYTNSTVSGGSDGFLLLLSDSGTEISHYEFGTPGYDEPHTVKKAVDENGWVVAGHQGTSTDIMTHNIFLTAIAGNGTPLWTHTYGGADHDGGEDMATTTEGYGIIGRSSSRAGMGEDILYVFVNADGSIRDQQWIGTASDDAGYGIAAEKHSFVLSGSSKGGPFGGKDIFLGRVKKK